MPTKTGYMLRPRTDVKKGSKYRGLSGSKYGNRRTQVDGIWFDSKGEAEHYKILKLREEAGEIHSIELQPGFRFMHKGEYLKMRSKGYPNGRTIKYKADFSFIENGKRVVQDFKGYDTDVSRLKRALVELFHGIRIQIITVPGGKPFNDF